MSNQVAQYRLFKTEESTIVNTQEIIEKIALLRNEIIAGSNHNDVSDYIIEPVYINMSPGPAEQRYFLRAKIHDFEYVGYLKYSASVQGTDSNGQALAGQYITGDNFNMILANGKLYDSFMTLMNLTLNSDGDNISFGTDIIVFITVADGKAYTTTATYIPETNEFNETTGTGVQLENISPQITFAHGKQLYACSVSGTENEDGEMVYKLVKIEDLP